LADQITVSRSGVRDTATDRISGSPDDLSIMANSATISTDIGIRLGVAERLLFTAPHAKHERNDIGSDGSSGDIFTDGLATVGERVRRGKLVRPGLGAGSEGGVPTEAGDTDSGSFGVVETEEEILGVGIETGSREGQEAQAED